MAQSAARAVMNDENNYVYAGTGTYGGALPRYAEPEIYPPSIPGVRARPAPETLVRPRVRESVGSQVSFSSIAAFLSIVILTVVLIYNIVMLFEEKANMYSTGAGGLETGLRAQLDELKTEQEKLTAEFEQLFGYDYVSAKAVEMYDMIPAASSGTERAAIDKAEIPPEAYSAQPVDIVDKLLGYLG